MMVFYSNFSHTRGSLIFGKKGGKELTSLLVTLFSGKGKNLIPLLVSPLSDNDGFYSNFISYKGKLIFFENRGRQGINMVKRTK